MQTINIRHRIGLLGAKTLMIFLLMAMASGAMAQKSAKSRTINMPDYEDKRIHYGFQIGLYQSTLNLRYKSMPDSVMAAIRPGFSLGFITNFRLNDDFWALRIMPNVSFYERNINFGVGGEQKLEATMVEVPVLIKYKSRRRKNHRMYMVGGATAGIQVGGKGAASEGLNFRRQNLELTYGVGFDWYWSFFKFAPELRFSHGLPNLLKPGSDAFSRQLDKVTTHRVSLILNFE